MPRLAWLTLLVALVVLAAVPAVWLLGGDAPAPPEAAAAPVAVSSSTTTSTTAPVPGPPRFGEALLRPGGDRSVLEPRSRPEPVAVRIPALRIEAPVVALGVDPETGQMDVPSNTRDVAWYRHGPLPGEAGSAVLAAHVDLDGRPGVFLELDVLQAGDRVEVELSNGTTLGFVVRHGVTYPREELPLTEIFATEGEPVLTLITCGGGFNRTERSYDSNVVVYATPAQPSPLPAA